MPPPQRVTNEEIINAYKATGSVWKAAKLLGVGGQTVHKRLARLGYPLAVSRWSEEELEELRELLTERISLTEISDRLGRTYASVALKASRLNLPREYAPRRRKLPRASGYDKATTKKRLHELLASGMPFTKFCRSSGYAVEQQARAIEKHFPNEWREYVESRSDLPQKTCEYCSDRFVPSSGKQRFCTRKCADQKRVDDSYFGGKRRQTIGLAERECQICLKTVERGLSSHHMLGKENDPDNTALIALCAGCHDLVTRLGARPWVNDMERLEALISLAWIRQNGPALAKRGDAWELLVSVDIDAYDDEEWE